MKTKKKLLQSFTWTNHSSTGIFVGIPYEGNHENSIHVKGISMDIKPCKFSCHQVGLIGEVTEVSKLEIRRILIQKLDENLKILFS